MSIVHHGYKTVPITKILGPGDIEKLRREPHTLELAASLEATGGKPADPVILEWGTWKLLGGRHRFAAALNAKLKEVDVLLLEGTPEQLEQACLVEQVRRRKCTDAEVARLLELEHPTPAQTFHAIEDDLEEEPPLAPRKPGRPSTGKGEALAKVAAVTGRTVAAVQQAEYRERHKDDPTPPPDPCIDTLGLEVSEKTLKRVALESEALKPMAREIIEMEKAITRLEKATGGTYQRIKLALHDAFAAVDAANPESACLWCKATKYQNGCIACSGTGYLTAGQMEAVTDAKLKLEGDDAGIYVDGEWVLLSDVA